MARCFVRIAFLLFILLADHVLVEANGHEPAVAEVPQPAAGDPEGLNFFERKVRPLLRRRCGECHNETAGQKNGELVLETAAGIRKGGSRGAAVLAGKPDESLLIKAVRYADSELEMPPEGKLPAEEIAILTEWVRRRAPRRCRRCPLGFDHRSGEGKAVLVVPAAPIRASAASSKRRMAEDADRCLSVGEAGDAGTLAGGGSGPSHVAPASRV